MSEACRTVPAIVAAGEGRASRAVHGRNKAYLEIEGRSLVARVVAVLQRVPSVSVVYVVGQTDQLAAVLDTPEMRAERTKPLVLVPQMRNLLENAWETYRRLLPGAGATGRDPETEAERDLPVLYLSTDLPFLTPQEVESFVQRSLDVDCDYALGLVPESSMEGFYARAPGEPGIEMAYFNIAPGRFRQSNLHLVKPARLGKRQRIQDMYEHRYQKQIGNAVGLAWRIAADQGGGLWILWYYLRMHLAGVADRRGMRRLADFLRRPITFERIELACSKLLGTRYRFVVTEVGGAAVDIDNEEDFAAAVAGFDRWTREQSERAEALVGPLAIAAGAGEPPEMTVLPPARSRIAQEASS